MAGIKRKPKINKGFKIIFRKKLKINIFLKVFVSPSAWSNAFNDTTNIKIIDPENITSVYLRPNKITSSVDPFNINTSLAKLKPKNVTNMESKYWWVRSVI